MYNKNYLVDLTTKIDSSGAELFSIKHIKYTVV